MWEHEAGRRRREVDNAAPSASRRAARASVEDSLYVDTEDAIELLIGDLFHALVEDDARIVDEDVHLAEPFLGSRKRARTSAAWLTSRDGETLSAASRNFGDNLVSVVPTSVVLTATRAPARASDIDIGPMPRDLQ